MPRAPRIEFAGAIYHVMNRGNHLDEIYRDDVDREMFMKTLEEACLSAGWVIHSFVLMNNHYHLLIETLRPTLVKGMQYLNSTYTRRYNVRHKTFGHLFQGRYKALLIDGEERGYFLTVSDYIHLNPVRANLVRDENGLLKDRWNSAGWLVGIRKKKPEWLRWGRVYGELGLKGWRRKSRKEYREYLRRRVEEVVREKKERHRIKNEEWDKIRRGWCLGSEGFIGEMKERLMELAEKPRDRESWNDEAMEELEEIRAMKYLREGVKVLGYKKVEEVKGRDRYVLGRWVRQRTKVSVKWIGEQMGVRTRGGMSSAIYLVGQRLQVDHKISRQWKLLERIL